MAKLKILEKNDENVNTSIYICDHCGWNGDISECEFDTYYNEFRDVDIKYPTCPKCDGGLTT